MHVFQSRNRAHLCESELCSRLEIRLLRSATDLFFARFAAQNRRFWVLPENQKNRTGWKAPPSLFVCETKRTKVCLLKSPRKRPCDRVLLWDPLEKYFFARAEHVKNGCFWAKNKPRVCAEAEWNQITKYNPTTFHVADKVHLAEFQLSYNRYSRLLRGRKKPFFFAPLKKNALFFDFFWIFLGISKIAPGRPGRRRYLFTKRKGLKFTFQNRHGSATGTQFYYGIAPAEISAGAPAAPRISHSTKTDFFWPFFSKNSKKNRPKIFDQLGFFRSEKCPFVKNL